MSGPRGERVDRRDGATIFLVSAAIMLFQIGLTRVLSVVAWYHFAFLIISLVMLGIGAPGVWFALARDPVRFLPGLLLASGITVPVSIGLIVAFGAALFEQSVVWLVACVLPATLSLGGVVCLVLIKAEGPSISRVYAADLLGAGLAAALVIPLMHLVPTPQLAAAVGVLPLACLLLHPGAWRAAAAVALAVSLAALFHGGVYRVTRSKAYDERVSVPLYEKWSPTARITIFDESFFYLAQHAAGFTWGRGSKYPRGRSVRQYWLEQDGSAGTPITEFDGDLGKLEHLLYDVTSVGYQLRPPRRVAIIGAGGGRDILSALLAGAKQIDAIELNSHTVDAVSDEFGWLSGDVYHAPGVRAVVSEGRSFLTHSDAEYDQIQVSLIDSWAASAAGAFALAENNLYTVEAFQLYAKRLSDDGLISVSRWPRELPRLLLLAHAAAEAMGAADPAAHLAVIAVRDLQTVLLSKRPFSRADIDRLDAIGAQRGFARIYPVDPGEQPPWPFIAELIDGRFAALAARGLNARPPTDDSPYFFNLVTPFAGLRGNERATGGPGGSDAIGSNLVRETVLAVGGLAAALFLLPFAARALRRGRSEPFARLLRATLYFAAIGAAFMLLENMLVQRFVLYLGHPSYATTVIIAGLLLGMGVGSRCANAVGFRRLRRFGAGVPVALLALVVALPSLIAGTLGWPLAARIAASALVLLPLGAALGLFFPLGMVHFGDRGKPWYWAINGVFGVFASVLSLALSMEFGFAAVGALSAAAYLAACACLWAGGRS